MQSRFMEQEFSQLLEVGAFENLNLYNNSIVLTLSFEQAYLTMDRNCFLEHSLLFLLQVMFTPLTVFMKTRSNMFTLRLWELKF